MRFSIPYSSSWLQSYFQMMKKEMMMMMMMTAYYSIGSIVVKILMNIMY